MNASADSLPMEPSEQDLLAAEYVLGVLDTDTRRSAETRAENDADFAQEIGAWEARLMPLLADIAAVPPPYSLWPRIRAAVGLDSVTASAPARSTSRPGLWQNTPFWRWLSAGAFAVAAASIAALLLVPRPVIRVPTPISAPPEKSAAPLIAKLTQDDGNALFVATLDARHGTLVVQPTRVEIPAGRVPELWVIPPGGVPHSLGLLDVAKARAIVVPNDLRKMLASHSIVAVTVEPPGGGPGGKPSGPIIAKGEISLL